MGSVGWVAADQDLCSAGASWVVLGDQTLVPTIHQHAATRVSTAVLPTHRASAKLGRLSFNECRSWSIQSLAVSSMLQ